MNPRVNPHSLIHGVASLSHVDRDLAMIAARFGPPPLWERPEGFATLVYIILEQQVSLASARAAYQRLEAAARPLTAHNFLRLSDEELKQIGFSRQKTAYGRNLAHAVAEGRLDLANLSDCEDEDVRSRLTAIKGIGQWTADIYLLMAMGRPDIWPSGDLALAVAVQEVKGMPARPTPAEMNSLSEAWRPLRAVAARLLWHYYLSRQ